MAALFPVSEIALGIFKRARRSTTTTHDRGSMMALWLVICLSMAAGIGAQWFRAARFPFARAPVYGTALALLVIGLAVRWAAIITLGRFFTVDVAVHHDHRIVQAGLYRFVRHPSYSGLLLAFLGVGISFANWLSLAVIIIPIVVALSVRIAIEERALRQALGAEYLAYCEKTARLIPGLY